jgi:hypothetical protein
MTTFTLTVDLPDDIDPQDFAAWVREELSSVIFGDRPSLEVARRIEDAMCHNDTLEVEPA